MSPLFDVLATTIAASAAQSLARVTKPLPWMAAGTLFVVVGLGFATAAGYQAIERNLGPVSAKLIMAAVFLVIGLVLFLVATLKKRAAEKRARLSDTASVAAAFAVGLASGLRRRQ